MASVTVTGSLVITGSTFVGSGIVTNGLDYYLDPGNINSLSNRNYTLTTPIKNLSDGAYSSSTYIPGAFSITTSSLSYSYFDPQFGGCLYVSASSTLISASNDTIDSKYLAGKPEVTLGIWHYPIPQPPATRIGNLFNSGYGVSSDKKLVCWIGAGPSGDATLTTIFYTTTILLSPSNPTILEYNKWNYVALVFDKGTAIVYVNGIPGTQVTGGGPTLRTTLGPANFRSFIIGGKSGGPNSGNMLGYLGPTQIYGRALSQQEVLQNYHTMKGRFGIYT